MASQIDTGFFKRSSTNFAGCDEIHRACFWIDAFALMQLIFIISVSSQFLLKKIRWCGQKLKTSTPEGNKLSYQGQENRDIKRTVSYQATKVCCLLMLTTHVLRLLLLQLQNKLSNCNYLHCMLSEGLQVLSWIILSLAAFSFQETKSTKLPLIIKTWWIFNFLQSTARVGFDHRLTLPEHEHIVYEEWINLFSFVLCAYLFAISARGKAGIRITCTDSSIIEPLWIPSVAQEMEADRLCQYGRASILQLITFSWMNPIIANGYRKPLEMNNVPDLDGKDSAKFVSVLFTKIIDDVELRQGLSTSSIYKAMFLFVCRKAMVNAALAVLSACASYVGPLLINDFLKFLTGDRPYGHVRGYLIALAILSAKVVEAIADSQWWFGAQQLGMRLRAALVSHVYQKGLKLSFSSRQKHTSGDIINYMDVDIQRISDFLWYTNYIWMLPIQLFLAFYVLYRNLGDGAWAGLAATMAVMACNIPLTKMQKKLQSKIMAAKDGRMTATSEILKSMKILKLQAWDMQYLQKIEALRNDEYRCLWRSARLSALTSLVFWGAPAFISCVTFGSCILMEIPLNTGSVLSALATFRMLQDPIFTLPDLLSVFAQGKVSADRVAKYLFDDPFSAVDAHTGSKIFKVCFAVPKSKGSLWWCFSSSNNCSAVIVPNISDSK